MNRKPLYFALVLAALLLTLHLYALHTHMYWTHRWFDIPMHILGGIAIGAFLVALFGTKRPALYFLLMLGIAVVWEIFEYMTGISTGQPDYWLDTTKDIFDGMLGSAITYLIAKKPLWR